MLVNVYSSRGRTARLSLADACGDSHGKHGGGRGDGMQSATPDSCADQISTIRVRADCDAQQIGEHVRHPCRFSSPRRSARSLGLLGILPSRPVEWAPRLRVPGEANRRTRCWRAMTSRPGFACGSSARVGQRGERGVPARCPGAPRPRLRPRALQDHVPQNRATTIKETT